MVEFLHDDVDVDRASDDGPSEPLPLRGILWFFHSAEYYTTNKNKINTSGFLRLALKKA